MTLHDDPPTLITFTTRTPWYTDADTTLTILHAVDAHGTRWVGFEQTITLVGGGTYTETFGWRREAETHHAN